MIRIANSGYGVNFNQLANARTSSQPIIIVNGVEFSYDDLNNVFNVSGTALNDGGRLNPLFNNIELKANHKYLFDINITGNVGGIFLSDAANNQYIYTTAHTLIYTPSQSYTSVILGSNVVEGREYSGTFGLQIFELTQMFGSGNEPTTVAEFREMYSNDYYDYTLSQWQWARKGKITSYPTPVIENGITLLPIENHIVGVAKNKVERIEIEGNSYQNGTPTPTSPIPIQSFNKAGGSSTPYTDVTRTDAVYTILNGGSSENNNREFLSKVLQGEAVYFQLQAPEGMITPPHTRFACYFGYPTDTTLYTLSTSDTWTNEGTVDGVTTYSGSFTMLASPSGNRLNYIYLWAHKSAVAGEIVVKSVYFWTKSDTVKLKGADGKELQLPNSITLNNQTISLELNKVGTYADKLIIDKASGKVELVRNVKEVLVDRNTSKATYTYGGFYNTSTFLDGSYAYQVGLCDYAIIHRDFNNQQLGIMVGAGNSIIYYCTFFTAVGATNASEFNTWLGDRVIKTIYGSNYPTTTDITNATYQINGITYNVSDWLNFNDREIEIETDGLAQSNLSVDYEPTLIYNYAKRELPVGFVRLDYIESTGTQYINTGLTTQIGLKVGIDFAFTSVSSEQLNGTQWYNNGGLAVGIVPNLDNSKFTALLGHTASKLGAKDTNRHYAEISIDSATQGTFSLDGQTNTESISYTSNGLGFSLFARTNSANIDDFCYERIYPSWAKINGSFARRYIPCYRFSDGVEGLYDTVGKQFYTNQGTGRFLRGKEINSGNLLNLSKFVQGYPSNTSETPVNRTFSEGTYVTGLTSNNYYNPTYYIRDFTVDLQSNSISFIGSGGGAIGFVVRLKKNTKYRIYYNITGSTVALSTYYSADGTYLGGVWWNSLDATGRYEGTITTPTYEFEYALILFRQGTNGAMMAFSNISLHEVN